MQLKDQNIAWQPRFKIDYGFEVEDELERLGELIVHQESIHLQFPSRWLALKLLEQDEDIQTHLQGLEGGPQILAAAQDSLKQLAGSCSEDVDTLLADKRYMWINTLVHEVVEKNRPGQVNLSDRLDRLVTHRWLGLPIFLASMWVVFKLTTDISAPLLDWVDGIISGPISHWVAALIALLGLGGTWVESFFLDGIIAGVGGVLVFVPVLTSLFLALAILEDFGYMARAAFVMDRFMQPLGLHGKSFLPMLVGFGCNVPALYATRTLENEKDRILTGLLIPLMSCGARLPVYVLFASIFFPSNRGLVVFSMYLLGILTAILLGILLKNTVFRGKEQSSLVMELPPYRLPNFKSLWAYVSDRTGSFLKNAWTIILATSIVIWLLMAVPARGRGSFANTDLDQSLFSILSGTVAPVLRPLGFESWEAGGALMTGFVAKEVVVSTMSQTYGIEEPETLSTSTTFIEDLAGIATSFGGALVDTLKSVPLIVGVNLFEEQEDDYTALMLAIRQDFETVSGGHGELAGLAFMVFVLLYTPCMVALAAERQELGAKWMWVSVFGQLILAWLVAFAVFQGGKLLGLG